MNESMMVIKNAAINVVTASLISKSSMSLSVKKRRNALMTNLNNPNVIIINGRAMMTKSHPVKKLIILYTMATVSAVM